MNKKSFNENLVFNEKKVSISVLLESDFSKEIRITMKKGQQMKEHQTPFPIVVHILKGSIDFGIKNQINSLIKDDIIALKGGIPHNLIANEDSVIRLSLSKPDSATRVEKVASNS